jgi:hypothetical protein
LPPGVELRGLPWIAGSKITILIGIDAMKPVLVALALGTTLCLTSTILAQAPEVNVPKEALEEMAYLVGDWNVTEQGSPDNAVATYTWMWTPGKHCLTWCAKWQGPQGPSHGSGIFGWDHSKKQFVAREQWSYGDSSDYFVKIKSASLWEGESTDVDGKGKLTKGTLKWEKKSPKEFVITMKSDSASKPAVVIFSKVEAK